MKGYRLTPLALQDLHHLDEIEMLVDQPGVGTPRPEWTDLEVLF